MKIIGAVYACDVNSYHSVPYLEFLFENPNDAKIFVEHSGIYKGRSFQEVNLYENLADFRNYNPRAGGLKK